MNNWSAIFQVGNIGWNFECCLYKSSSRSVSAQVQLKSLLPKMKTIILGYERLFEIGDGGREEIFSCDIAECPETMTIVVDVTVFKVSSKWNFDFKSLLVKFLAIPNSLSSLSVTLKYMFCRNSVLLKFISFFRLTFSVLLQSKYRI